jgi:hypothetical protein
MMLLVVSTDCPSDVPPSEKRFDLSRDLGLGRGGRRRGHHRMGARRRPPSVVTAPELVFRVVRNRAGAVGGGLEEGRRRDEEGHAALRTGHSLIKALSPCRLVNLSPHTTLSLTPSLNLKSLFVQSSHFMANKEPSLNFKYFEMLLETTETRSRSASAIIIL